MNCKRIVAALMCAVIPMGTTALSLGVPVTLSAEAATIVDSGNYGENIKWQLDSDGTLVVRGKGDMGDVGPFKNTPWVKERDLIKKVVISNGITRVGEQNFYFCENLVSVTFPDTLKTIGFAAFMGCSSITSIVIPDSVTDIGHEAFKSCSNAEITISSTDTKIEGGALSDTKWEKEQLEKSSLVIVNGVLLAARDETEKVVIPDGVECIGMQCFQGKSKMTEIVIPDSVKIIEAYAFEVCRSLRSVTIPESVEKIRQGAFQSCKALEEVCILNPECDIPDLEGTFSNGAGYAYTGIIKGYRGSTAEAYANKYGRIFVPVDPGIGDVNFDGNVNAVDASMVLAYYARVSTNQESGYYEEQMLAADVNHDGMINAVDASNILAYYAYVSTTPEVEIKSLEEFISK